MGLWCERLTRLTRPATSWGAYGDVLVHGLAAERDDETQPLLLRRTGPFLPPLTQPKGAVIVDDDARRRLLASDLTGFSFGPVLLQRVTEVPWNEWNRSLPMPPEPPPSEDPESYVDELIHRPDLLARMGTLHELRPDRDLDVNDFSGIRVIESTWGGSDFVGALGTRWVLVSAKARAWLEMNFREWVAFDAVPAAG